MPSSSTRPAVWVAAGLEMTAPRRLTFPTAWVGHLPFAFWIVEKFRPRQIVELGVHTGNSYCSFCEAVDRLDLSTQCAGVDHWMGDEQAGHYGDEIYDELKAHHDPYYRRFSRLLRMGFDAAAATFADGSVDLLHIDGFHTYEAVSHDFLTWKSKLSACSIVLFHDTNVRERNFGVWKFFEEMEAAYPSFNFLQSNGLGVIYTGTDPMPDAVAPLFQTDAASRDAARAYFSRLGDNLVTQLDLKTARDRARALAGSAYDAQTLRQRLHLASEHTAVIEDALSTTRYALAKQAEYTAVAERVSRDLEARSSDLAAQVAAQVAALRVVQRQWEDLHAEWNDANRWMTDLFQLPIQDFLVRTAALAADRGAENRAVLYFFRRALAAVPQPAGSISAAPPQADAAPALAPSDTVPALTDAPFEDARAVIVASGLFDPDYYPGIKDAEASGMDPLAHYLTVGENVGLAPSAAFDPAYYGRRYPDIAASGYGLLRHYAEFGRAEGRYGLPRSSRLALPKVDHDGRFVLLIVLESLEHTKANALALAFLEEAAADLDIHVFAFRGGGLADAFSSRARGLYRMVEDPSDSDKEVKPLAERIAATLAPDAALLFGSENHALSRQFIIQGIATVSYLHDTALNIYDVYDNLIFWGTRTIFSSRTLLDEAKAVFLPARLATTIDIVAPAVQPFPPAPPPMMDVTWDAITAFLRPPGMEDAFVVAVNGGADYFHLAIAAAMTMRQTELHRPIRLAWLGESTVLQKFWSDIQAAGLEAAFVSRPLSEQAEIVLALSDAILVLPGIPAATIGELKALRSGIPALTISSRSEIAEWLAGVDATRDCVMPHMDYHAAAARLSALASDAAHYASASEAVRTVTETIFAPQPANSRIVEICRAAARTNASVQDAIHSIENAGVFDRELYNLRSNTALPLREEIARYSMQTLVTDARQDAFLTFRRPTAGFNPHAYAEHVRSTDAPDFLNPLDHYVKAGKPSGWWSHEVIRPSPTVVTRDAGSKLAIHGHFHYPEFIGDFLKRLGGQDRRIDLYLTATTDAAAEELRQGAAGYIQGSLSVTTVSNKGRDIGPFLQFLQSTTPMNYDAVGHFHGKKSDHMATGLGASWRTFLWENLLGGRERMIDVIIAEFEKTPDLGLVFAEDPRLNGWGENQAFAEALASRMQLKLSFPTSFDFPAGTMFWARPKALKPLIDLDLQASEYPSEPIGVDGTILHAIERLIPFVVEKQGFSIATTRTPGVMLET
jgi:hypothetical protein